MDVTNNRLQRTFSETTLTRNLNYAGNEDLLDLLVASGESINTNSKSFRTILGNSAFTFDLFHEVQEGNQATLWGVGDQREFIFDRNAGLQSWSGDLYANQFGFDVKSSNSILSGISYSAIESNINYLGTMEDELNYQFHFNSIDPYIGWSSTDRTTQITGVIGSGIGEIRLEQNNYKTVSMDSSFYKIGFSGYHQLLSTKSNLRDNSFELEISGNTWVVEHSLIGIVSRIENLRSHISSHQINVNSSYEKTFELQNIFKSNASIGFQSEQMHKNSKFGLNISSGFSLINPSGISIIGKTSSLLLTQEKKHNWDVIGNLSFDSENNNLGILLNLSVTKKNSQNSDSDLIGGNKFLKIEDHFGHYSKNFHLNAELGYGSEEFHETARVTPFGKFDYSNGQSTKFHVGTRILSNSDLNLKIEVVISNDLNNLPRQEFALQGAIYW